MLDMLCLSGEIAWMRLSTAHLDSRPPLLVPATPIALFLREHRDAWTTTRAGEPVQTLTPAAGRVLEFLRERGASFLPDVASACGLNTDALRQAIGALVACGARSRGWFLRFAQPVDDCTSDNRARAQPIHRPMDRHTGGVIRGPGRGAAHAGLGAAASLRRRLPAADDP